MSDKPHNIPEFPILTSERVMQALLEFMSRERTIEEAANLKGINETTLRARIKHDPVYQRSVIPVSKFDKDGKHQVRTNMRMQWLAEDRAGETFARHQQQIAEAQKSHRRRAES